MSASLRCPDCGHQNLPGEETCQSCQAPLAELSIPQPKDRDRKRILEGTIADLKPCEAVTARPHQTVAEAVSLMRKHKMGCVLVTEDGELVGIFTERDLLMDVAGLKDPSDARLSEVMKKDPQCLRETDSIAFAFHNMAVKEHRHIPVVREAGTFGIISSRDLLRYLCS